MSMCSNRGLGTSAEDWPEIGVEMMELAASVRNTKNTPRIFFSPSAGRPAADCTANSAQTIHVERTPTHAKPLSKRSAKSLGSRRELISKVFSLLRLTKNK